jgi:hypothetical protein
MAIAPSALARSVLPRLLCGLAARAHFSTDRIAETQLLADTLVMRTDGSIGASHLSVQVGVAPRILDVQLGPLNAGQANTLIDDSLGGMLTRLADTYQVSHVADSSEVLVMQLAARR